jgi:hypothetical protein
MLEYQPEKLAFASLESDEVHYHSFFLYGAKPSFLYKYLPESAMYVGHFTDRRLIIEPWKMPGFVSVAIDIVKIATTSLSPSVGIDQIIKGMAKQAKDSLAKTAFMADTQMYWSIPYKDIAIFETQDGLLVKNTFVRVVTVILSDRDAFIFQAAKITEQAKKGLGGEWGIQSKINFCNFGNQFRLQQEAREQVELQKKEINIIEETKKSEGISKIGKGIIFILIDFIIFTIVAITFPFNPETPKWWATVYFLVSLLIIPVYGVYLILSGLIRGLWIWYSDFQK